MLIKDVSSLDPHDKHDIVFVRPLTLIVGLNGPSKTTIIERLKQCIGELPPNYTFIHDLKVSGVTETKEQIKHRFKTAAGNDVCIRSSMLTQKASEMEFKALERLLGTINPQSGEKVCLSSLCADMDKEIPALMGASKAILENVIFVRQGDSSWPVQDPKKKFDDIFSASLHAKALEVIKMLHKEQAFEIETYKLELQNIQTLKGAAYELSATISQEQEIRKSLKAQINELKRNIQPVEGKILHTETTLKELQILEKQISTSTAVISTFYEDQRIKCAKLAEEYKDIDEKLETWQTKSEERIAILQSKVCKLEREMSDEEINGAKLLKKIKKTMQKIVMLQAEDEAHSKLVNERDLRIQMILKEHNLGKVPKRSFGDKVAAKLLKRIKTRIGKDLQDKKKSNEMELKLLWEQNVKAEYNYYDCEANKQSKIQRKAVIIKQIEAKENERKIAEHELDRLNLCNIVKEEKKLKAELQQKTNVLSSKNFESIITQKKAEVHSLEQKIMSLEQDRRMTDNVKDADMLLVMKEEELGSCMKRLMQLSEEIESLRDEWQMMEDDLKCVTKGYHSFRAEKLKAKYIIEELNKTKKDLSSLTREKDQVDLDEEHLAEAIGPLLKEKEKLDREYIKLKIKLDREYDEQAEKKRKFKQEHNKVQVLSSKIKKYIDSGKQEKQEKLKDLQEKVSLFESSLEKSKSRKEKLSAKLLRTKELLDDLDSLNCPKVEEEVERLAREIDMLKDKKSSIGRTAFETETDLKKQRQEKERLLSKLNRCLGALSGYQSNISKHKLVLKQLQYTDIDKRYFKQRTRLQTTKMANKDLDRYYNALEKAFMRFHSKKMKEMNKIIKELWQQTYRGQDIDYISILSDSEGAGTFSYSYHVVMHTGNAELEMHRRCSTGQKVLASLIIRLALAETFCLNCGMLALDEPTADLDEPSAESLAAALLSILRIMEERRGQENFLLIVTSNDEYFAQLIDQSQYVERDYHATKNDHQRSIIEAHMIFD